MNVIDILVGIILIWAIYKGWKNGILTQLAAIIGILVGSWAAFQFTEITCSALDISIEYKWIMFIIIVIAVMILVAILSYMLTKLLAIAGASVVISLLGATVSVLKILIVLALLVRTFDNISHKAAITESTYLQQSTSYKPLNTVADIIFPYLNDWLLDPTTTAD